MIDLSINNIANTNSNSGIADYIISAPDKAIKIANLNMRKQAKLYSQLVSSPNVLFGILGGIDALSNLKINWDLVKQPVFDGYSGKGILRGSVELPLNENEKLIVRFHTKLSDEDPAKLPVLILERKINTESFVYWFDGVNNLNTLFQELKKEAPPSLSNFKQDPPTNNPWIRKELYDWAANLQVPKSQTICNLLKGSHLQFAPDIGWISNLSKVLRNYAIIINPTKDTSLAVTEFAYNLVRYYKYKTENSAFDKLEKLLKNSDDKPRDEHRVELLLSLGAWHKTLAASLAVKILAEERDSYYRKVTIDTLKKCDPETFQSLVKNGLKDNDGREILRDYDDLTIGTNRRRWLLQTAALFGVGVVGVFGSIKTVEYQDELNDAITFTPNIIKDFHFENPRALYISRQKDYALSEIAAEMRKVLSVLISNNAYSRQTFSDSPSAQLQADLQNIKHYIDNHLVFGLPFSEKLSSLISTAVKNSQIDTSMRETILDSEISQFCTLATQVADGYKTKYELGSDYVRSNGWNSIVDTVNALPTPPPPYFVPTRILTESDSMFNSRIKIHQETARAAAFINKINALESSLLHTDNGTKKVSDLNSYYLSIGR